VSGVRVGATLGSVAMAAYLLARFGLPPADGFILSIFGVLILGAGVLGSGAVLGWLHVARNPRILVSSALLLGLLSIPLLVSYQRGRHATPSFLAGADSVRGVITGRNVFRNLLITFRPDSAHLARIVAKRKRAHDHLTESDSIWVYRQREPPHAIDVWPPGPDAASMMRRLGWLWLVGAVLITGYGPVLRAWFRNPHTDTT